MAKIALLGGCGGMGEYTLRTMLLPRFKETFSDIILADLNEKRAVQLVKDLDDSRIQLRKLDVTDKQALLKVINGCNVVANCVGPFFKYNQCVLEAAIEAGVHYIDICDDTGPSLEALSLDEDAKSKDLICLVGMGASPGVTNIMARHCMNQLDNLESCTDVHISWSASSFDIETEKEPTLGRSKLGKVKDTAKLIAKVVKAKAKGREPKAVSYHAVSLFVGKVEARKDGEDTLVDTLTEIPGLFFPGVDFSWNSFYVNHPENATLSKCYPWLKSASNAFCICGKTFQMLRKFKRDVERGKLDTKLAALIVEMDESPPDGFLPFDGGMVTMVKGTKDSKPTLVACASKVKVFDVRKTVEGDKAVDSKHLIKHNADEAYIDMAALTAVPLVLGVVMILKGFIEQRGVMFPDQCIDPVPFFWELGSMCTPPIIPDQVVRLEIEQDTERVEKFPFDNSHFQN